MTEYYYLCLGCNRRLDATTDDVETIHKHGYPSKVVCGYCGAEGFVKIPRQNPRQFAQQYQPSHG